MKMKIIRKILGLFLAFTLLFAVLFVVAPQEEVKADIVANNITSIDDLKGTVWNLKEDVSYITFGVECWLTFTVSGSASPFTYRTNNSLMTQNKIIIFGEQNDNLSFQENMLSTSKTIFSNGTYNSNYGTLPRRLIFNDWNSYGFFYGNENIFLEYLNKIAVQQITDVNELKGTSWKMRQDITNIQIDDSGYAFGFSDESNFATIFTEENEQEINWLFTAVATVDSVVNMALIVSYELGTEIIQEPLYYFNDYLIDNATLTFNNSENELLVNDLSKENTGTDSYLTWYETFTIFFEEIPTNYITIIDNVNNTTYEIEYQEGYTLEANNIYLNALEYQKVEANNPFSNLVEVYKKFTGWRLSSATRGYDITLPFTFTSQYSGEDWILLPQYEDIDYIPFNLIVNNVREGVESEEVSIWGAIPVINNEVVINNNMLAFLNYSLIIGAEKTDEEAPPTINYKANILFNNLELNNNQIILSSDVNSSNIIAVELTYLSNAIFIVDEETTGENVVSYYKNYNISGNYTDTINIADRTTNAYIEIKIAVRNNTPVDTGDINVKSAFTTFFSLVGGFLSMKLGFITLGEIIGLVLAIALLGFIFKVWNGGNNG